MIYGYYSVGVGYTDRTSDEGLMYDVDEVRCVSITISNLIIYAFNIHCSCKFVDRKVHGISMLSDMKILGFKTPGISVHPQQANYLIRHSAP